MPEDGNYDRNMYFIFTRLIKLSCRSEWLVILKLIVRGSKWIPHLRIYY